ncbi:MAG: peptidoglycan bridge formation glycyltransferase FemA/FemB family protein [Candidatus Rokubacteria bacterium]|nr:peptidoglycan bridge formation glycyltransferase FemA/FemB family protein [Candidatus Rokubacteria bacterium]
MTPLTLVQATEPRSELQVRDVTCMEEWDSLVAGLGGHLRQGWAWGELGGRPVHRRAITEAGHAVAAISLTEIRLPAVPYTVLYGSRGPVIGPRTRRTWSAMLETIRDVARARRAIFVRLSPGEKEADPHFVERLGEHAGIALDAQWTVWNAPRVVMTLAIRGTEAEVKRAMRESTRLSLTKAVKAGVGIARDSSAEAIARFHGLLVGTGKRRGYPVRRLEHFQALGREYLDRGDGVVVLASYQGRDIAGALGTRFGRSAYVLYSAIDAEFRALRAGIGVHWDLIKWAREHGCERMDWGGAVTRYPPSTQDAGYGIYDFKRGFGCEISLVAPYFDLVLKPRLYRAVRLLEQRGGLLMALRARFN